MSRYGAGGRPAPWTSKRLRRLREMNRSHPNIRTLGVLFDCTARDVNIALNALLGRTPEEAAEVLYPQGADYDQPD